MTGDADYLLKVMVADDTSVSRMLLVDGLNEIGIKKMTTRWGTCAIKARRVWINLALALFPPECLEMVVVHELTHLIERNHSKRFYALMTTYMPGWQVADKLLDGGIPHVD